MSSLQSSVAYYQRRAELFAELADQYRARESSGSGHDSVDREVDRIAFELGALDRAYSGQPQPAPAAPAMVTPPTAGATAGLTPCLRCVSGRPCPDAVARIDHLRTRQRAA